MTAAFKGMSYPMLSAGALNAIYFGTYGLTLDLISKSNGCVVVGSGRGIIASTKSEKASSNNIGTLQGRHKGLQLGTVHSRLCRWRNTTGSQLSCGLGQDQIASTD